MVLNNKIIFASINFFSSVDSIQRMVFPNEANFHITYIPGCTYPNVSDFSKLWICRIALYLGEILTVPTLGTNISTASPTLRRSKASASHVRQPLCFVSANSRAKRGGRRNTYVHLCFCIYI